MVLKKESVVTLRVAARGYIYSCELKSIGRGALGPGLGLPCGPVSSSARVSRECRARVDGSQEQVSLGLGGYTLEKEQESTCKMQVIYQTRSNKITTWSRSRCQS